MNVAAAGPIQGRTRAIYFGARFTAQMSQNILLAALFVAAATSTRAAIDLSSVFVAILIPAVLLGPLGGAIVDRISPARGMVLGAILRTAVVAVGLVVLGTGGWAWPVAFAYSLVSQIYTPAEMALVRSIQRENAGRAHSLLVTLQYAGQFTGMILLAPPLFALGGIPAMLAVSTVGFLLVVVAAATIRPAIRHTPAGRPQETRDAFSFRQTISFFASENRAVYAIFALGFKTIVSRVVFVAMPLYLAQDMGLDQSFIFYLVAPGIVGVVVALVWCGRSMSLERASDVMRLSFVGMIVSIFALAVLDYGITAFARYSQVPPVVRLEAEMNTTFAVALPVAFLLGMSLTGALVAARVAITETAPLNQQARVFAVQETLSEALVIVPLLFAGIGTQFAGARPVLAVVGVAAIVAFAWVESRGRKGLRIEPAPALADDPLARTLVL